MMRQISKSAHPNFCTKANTDKSRFSNTVLLPKTKLPLRLEHKRLLDRDRLLSNSPQFMTLYKWQRSNLNSNEFILHDGPPYANGMPHMGHAINKVLKDVILRTNILRGIKVNYIPGWDCHGLPIELKAISYGEETDPITIRKRARSFATETISKQKLAFLSWGVIGDWSNAYATYHSHYIKNQMVQFYNLYEKGLVYRDVKPVYWSPSTRTALAEAELEYNTSHRSTAITLKVKVESTLSSFNITEPLYALIWTTTPWTLPSNQAICYNPKLSYSIVKNVTNMEYYIVATNLIGHISHKLGSDLKVLQSFEGSVLKNVCYIHPIYKDKVQHFLPALHATESKGTGLVHTAPAHGQDDYVIALENNISVHCVVDENGKFISEAGPDLNGLYVLSDGTQSVISLLRNDILHIEDYVHSYPYDWRTKQPVILRASKQWFIDTDSIKQRAIDLLENVKIIPEIHSEMYKHSFKLQLQKRPYWCISRQRSWGVPIPVFYLKDTDDVIINRDILNAVSSFVDENGCDFWWELDMKEILKEPLLKRNNLSLDNIKKGQDILDIWFDSGLSWSSVFSNKEIPDLYLEGVDQFTGWFQSSLLTSTALKDCAPYKTIYVHGFAVDENGKKMSKSIGNVVNPEDILMGNKQQQAYGIDSLRWWVACHANQGSTAEVSTTALKASKDDVQKVRSVLRFAVGALFDYENSNINYADLRLIDKYMLHLTFCYQKKTEEYLNHYQYHKVKASVIQFLTNDVSAFYYSIIKDRLYCDMQDSFNRKSAQYVINIILQIVTRTIAPIVPHLAEELYTNFPYQEVDSYFKTKRLEACKSWYSEEIIQIMSGIMNFRKEINIQCGSTSLDKDITICLNKEFLLNLEKYIDINNLPLEMSEILQVANVDIMRDDSIKNGDYEIDIIYTKQHNCPRCRKFSSNSANELCYRCNIVVNNAKIRVVN